MEDLQPLKVLSSGPRPSWRHTTSPSLPPHLLLPLLSTSHTARPPGSSSSLGDHQYLPI